MTTPESRSPAETLSDLIDYAGTYQPMSPGGNRDFHRTMKEARKLLNDLSVKSALTSSEKATKDSADAARYRWLREERDEQQPVVTIVQFSTWGQPWRDVPLWGDELDAAVDKAMLDCPERRSEGNG